MISPILLAVALSQAPATPEAAAPKVDAPAEKVETAALVAGTLPDDPAKTVLQGKCLICHTADYVTQQRLTEGQWLKTVEKMRKFGAPVTDAEVKQLAGYLGRYWTPDLPAPRVAPVAAPKGALPPR